MSNLIEEKGKVVSFTLFKVEKGREKLCKCNPPHYEIDTVNRLVTCRDCGATLDSFDALVTICNYVDQYEAYQKEAIQKINTYREMANAEWRRRIKNMVFKDMDKQYQNGMYPYCPKCGEMINPIEITRWGNKKLCENEEVKNE